MTRGGAPAPQVVLRLAGITRRFGGVLANDAIDLTLNRGEILALLGENGAGKTTLMNILFGQYAADSGTVELFGKPLPPGNPAAALAAGLGMVHQHFTLADNLSVLDNILLGTVPLGRPSLGRAGAGARVRTLAQDFGLAVDPAARVGDLSVGERQRVEILKALYRDARVLILDEPTAVLTPQESTALFATLRRAAAGGLSVIFISHKLDEVMTASHRVVVLRHGRVVGEVATARTTPEALAALMVGAPAPRLSIRPGRAGPVLLALDKVHAGQGGLRGIDLALRSGQITGIAGVAGNGQAALSDLISGLLGVQAGTLLVDGQIQRRWSPRRALARGIGRIPEDRHRTGTVASFTVTENVILERYAGPPFSRAGLMDWGAARRAAASIIARFDVRCEGPEAPIRLLSGGNMQKLILGRVLDAGPRIILANQPVRGLDVGAISYVQGQLIAARDAGAAILLISEDLDEIIALSDVIHVMFKGRLSAPLPRGACSAADIGLLMGGTGFADEVGHAA